MNKEMIIEAFQKEKMHVEITENKNGQIVISRMCELYKNQVFAEDTQWNETVEKTMKEKIQLLIRPALRKMIVEAQNQGTPIKPILTLAGPLPKRNSFTFDLVFMMRLEYLTECALQDTIQLIYHIEQFLSSIHPKTACA